MSGNDAFLSQEPPVVRLRGAGGIKEVADRRRNTAETKRWFEEQLAVNVQVQTVRGSGNTVAGRNLVVLSERAGALLSRLERPLVEQPAVLGIRDELARRKADALVEQPAADELAWIDDLVTGNPPPAGPGPDAGIFSLLGYLIRLRLWRRVERLRARASR